jgi:hypothetical protein
VFHVGVKKLTKKLAKQYAGTLGEGLVIAIAFALVDRLRGSIVTTAMTAGGGLLLGVFLGLSIAEHNQESDAQV